MNITAYSPDIEAQMLNFYNSLSEKDRRRYAAIEATKLGHGGALIYVNSCTAMIEQSPVDDWSCRLNFPVRIGEFDNPVLDASLR